MLLCLNLNEKKETDKSYIITPASFFKIIYYKKLRFKGYYRNV